MVPASMARTVAVALSVATVGIVLFAAILPLTGIGDGAREVGFLHAAAGPSASSPPNPFSSGMAASVAIGQPTLTLANSGHGPQNLTVPQAGVTFDSHGDLWVSDTDNNRVLEYVPPFADGMSASVALGQASLTGYLFNVTKSGLFEPRSIAFDASGDLWVVDAGSNRVVEFVPPFHTGMNASLVLGQSGFTTGGPGTSSTNFTGPSGIAFAPGGDLVVSDAANNRLMIFDPPFTIGESASLVIGQTTFLTHGAGTSATNLSDPWGLAIGPTGSVWVADDGNNRVLEFAPPFSDGMAASLVLGQTGYAANGSSLPDGMETPMGVGFDANEDLWVAESGYNRMVEYLAPLTLGEMPSLVLGQSSLAGSHGGTTAVNESRPSAVATDASGNLWVADTLNERVIEYAPPLYGVVVNETGVDSGDNWSVTFNGIPVVAIAPAVISFSVPNGTYPFSAASLPGYVASPSSGIKVVNGTAIRFTITFTLTLTPPVTTWGSWWWIVVVVVILAAALILIAIWRRRRRGAPAPGTTVPPGVTGGDSGVAPPVPPPGTT